jgi:hypothetical protein
MPQSIGPSLPQSPSPSVAELVPGEHAHEVVVHARAVEELLLGEPAVVAVHGLTQPRAALLRRRLVLLGGDVPGAQRVDGLPREGREIGSGGQWSGAQGGPGDRIVGIKGETVNVLI